LAIDLTESKVSVVNHASKLKIMLTKINKPIDQIDKEDLRDFLAFASEKYAIESYNCFVKTIRRFFRDHLNKPELAHFNFKTVPFNPKNA